MTKVQGTWYQRNWPRVGAALGVAIAAATTAAGDRMSRPQKIAAYNMAALMAHQFEEYVWPKPTFARVHNKAMLGSDQPDWPLNTVTAKGMNVHYVYPFHLLPVLLPQVRPLGVAPAVFGMMQNVVHSIVYPARGKERYVSGAVTAALLHLPLGIAWFRAANAEKPLTRKEVAMGLAYMAAFDWVSLGRPTAQMRREVEAAHAG